MITLRVSTRQMNRIRRELRRAGRQEIGGVLAAENLEGGVFSLVDFSVQRSGGSATSFVREPIQHRKFMRLFFQLSGYQFERFNYIGEWHSHPSFPAYPSPTDFRQMQRIVEDPLQAASFAVLLIVRLGARGGIEASAHAFRRGLAPVRISIEIDDGRSVMLATNTASNGKPCQLRRQVVLKSDTAAFSRLGRGNGKYES